MRALVLSGGGAHGAYQAGALLWLTAGDGQAYDLIAGVSVGALNASLLAQYSPAEQVEGAKRLWTIWKSIRGNSDVYKSWPLGKLQGFWKGGAYNNAPLEAKVVRPNLDPSKLRSSGVKLRIGSVAYSSGNYYYVTEQEPNIIDWVMASSAFPVAFPPRKIGSEYWTDGGIRDVTPIKDVFADNPDAIDIVMCSPVAGDRPTAPVAEATNFLYVALRAASLMSDEVISADIAAIPEHWLPKVRIVAPEKPLEYGSLDFDPKAITKAVDLGYSDAQRK